VLSASLAHLTLAQAPGGIGTAIDVGDPASESRHSVTSSYSERVSFTLPEHWIMSVRASAYEAGHAPASVIDGKAKTHWQVSGPPQAPMARGNWIEVDLNRAMEIDEIAVHWYGDAPYDYKIYEKPFSDFRRLELASRSRGQGDALETIRLPRTVNTRAIRIEFATDPDGAPQGIRELRIGGLAFPDAYAPAAFADAPIEEVHRIYYLEFERIRTWPVFNPKYPLADGGSARRLLPREDSFEGGQIDFRIAVAPEQDNWITLKLWESEPGSMVQRGNLIALQTLGGDATQRNRTFLPAFVTEQQHTEQEWYGLKPQPGRWSYAHYQLPAELVGPREILDLRLLGVGNLRRDYPMRAASPPIYEIRSQTQPAVFE
jgi:hypothetical protein